MSYKLAGVIWNDDGTMATKELTELTPLQALNKIAGITNYDGGKNLKALGNFHKKEFALIETTLKDYEGAKEHIKALNKERVENSIKLKALEIIRKKEVDVHLFKICPNYEYNNWIRDDERQLTKEEYDLLKEILTDGKEKD